MHPSRLGQDDDAHDRIPRRVGRGALPGSEGPAAGRRPKAEIPARTRCRLRLGPDRIELAEPGDEMPSSRLARGDMPRIFQSGSVSTMAPGNCGRMPPRALRQRQAGLDARQQLLESKGSN